MSELPHGAPPTGGSAPEPEPQVPAEARPEKRGATGPFPQVAQRAPVLSVRGLRKSYKVGDRTLEILHGIDLDLRPGELVALVGSSGAGKSTLLHILGLLDKPTEGQVNVMAQDAWARSTAERAKLRNKEIGFVFQFYHLLPELTAKGMRREDAYRIVQGHAMAAWQEGGDFEERILKDPEVKKAVSADAVARVFALDEHLVHVDRVFERVFGE